MIYLYAIVDEKNPMQYPASYSGRSINVLTYRGMGAVISTVSAGELDMNEKNIMAHNNVLLALAKQCTVLPVQFGTVLKDNDAVLDLLGRYGSQFEASLSRLAGKVEMGVKVLWGGPERDNEKKSKEKVWEEDCSEQFKYITGKAFLMSRYLEQREELRHERKAGEIASSVNKDIAQAALESRPRVKSRGKLILNGAYLVPADNIQKFRNHVQNVKAERSNLKFLVSGPWPPYNFVDIRCF